MSEPQVSLKPSIHIYLAFNGYKWVATSPDRRDIRTHYPHPGPRAAADDFAKQVTGRDKNALQRISPKHYELFTEEAA
jgi:hypothetical protein